MLSLENCTQEPNVTISSRILFTVVDKFWCCNLSFLHIKKNDQCITDDRKNDVRLITKYVDHIKNIAFVLL